MPNADATCLVCVSSCKATGLKTRFLLCAKKHEQVPLKGTISSNSIDYPLQLTEMKYSNHNAKAGFKKEPSGSGGADTGNSGYASIRSL